MNWGVLIINNLGLVVDNLIINGFSVQDSVTIKRLLRAQKNAIIADLNCTKFSSQVTSNSRKSDQVKSAQKSDQKALTSVR